MDPPKALLVRIPNSLLSSLSDISLSLDPLALAISGTDYPLSSNYSDIPIDLFRSSSPICSIRPDHRLFIPPQSMSIQAPKKSRGIVYLHKKQTTHKHVVEKTKKKPPAVYKENEALRISLIHSLAPAPLPIELLARKVKTHPKQILQEITKIAKKVDNVYLLIPDAFRDFQPFTWNYTEPERSAAIQNAAAAYESLKLPKDSFYWKRLVPPDNPAADARKEPPKPASNASSLTHTNNQPPILSPEKPYEKSPGKQDLKPERDAFNQPSNRIHDSAADRNSSERIPDRSIDRNLDRNLDKSQDRLTDKIPERSIEKSSFAKPPNKTNKKRPSDEPPPKSKKLARLASATRRMRTGTVASVSETTTARPNSPPLVIANHSFPTSVSKQKQKANSVAGSRSQQDGALKINPHLNHLKQTTDSPTKQDRRASAPNTSSQKHVPDSARSLSTPGSVHSSQSFPQKSSSEYVDVESPGSIQDKLKLQSHLYSHITHLQSIANRIHSMLQSNASSNNPPSDIVSRIQSEIVSLGDPSIDTTGITDPESFFNHFKSILKQYRSVRRDISSLIQA